MEFVQLLFWWLALVSWTAQAWIVASPRKRITTRLQFENEPSFMDSHNFPLSESDISRLTAMRERHLTIPILIMEALVPGQELEFASSDPKFFKLIAHALEHEQEIGILGMNPMNGNPLNMGVTVSVKSSNVKRNPIHGGLELKVKGHRRFEVQGQAKLDSTKSFFLARVEIVDSRAELALSTQQQSRAQELLDSVPQLIQDWIQHVLLENQHKLVVDLLDNSMSQMPQNATMSDVSFWMASLLNPSSSIPPSCVEIRPAMLACKTELDRIHLACTAMQSSIKHLQGKQNLF